MYPLHYAILKVRAHRASSLHYELSQTKYLLDSVLYEHLVVNIPNPSRMMVLTKKMRTLNPHLAWHPSRRLPTMLLTQTVPAAQALGFGPWQNCMSRFHMQPVHLVVNHGGLTHHRQKSNVVSERNRNSGSWNQITIPGTKLRFLEPNYSSSIQNTWNKTQY